MKKLLYVLILCLVCFVCSCHTDKRTRTRRGIDRTSPEYQKVIERLYGAWREQERLKKRQQKLDEFMDWYEKKYGEKK